MEKGIDCVPSLSRAVSTSEPSVKFMTIEASMKNLEKAPIFYVCSAEVLRKESMKQVLIRG